MADEPIAAAPDPQTDDRRLRRIIVAFLGGTLLVVLIGAIALPFVGKDLPSELFTLGAQAFAALAAMVTPAALIKR